MAIATSQPIKRLCVVIQLIRRFFFGREDKKTQAHQIRTEKTTYNFHPSSAGKQLRMCERGIRNIGNVYISQRKYQRTSLICCKAYDVNIGIHISMVSYLSIEHHQYNNNNDQKRNAKIRLVSTLPTLAQIEYASHKRQHNSSTCAQRKPNTTMIDACDDDDGHYEFRVVCQQDERKGVFENSYTVWLAFLHLQVQMEYEALVDPTPLSLHSALPSLPHSHCLMSRRGRRMFIRVWRHRVCFWFAACWPEIDGCYNVFASFIFVSINYLVIVSG